MVGLWLTEGKGKHAVESMAWLGGKWKSSEVLLVVRGMEQTISWERVLQKLSLRMDASKAPLAWLMERKGRKVEVAVMERWGLLNSVGLSDFEQRRWEVRRAVFSSGRTHDFRPGRYYASHRSVGGRKTFWKVDFHSLETSFVLMLDEAGSQITSDLEVVKRDGKLDLEVELVFGIQKRVEAMEWLDQYCTSHPDEVIAIGGPGHREVTELTQPYRTHESVFCRATHGECARASFANALRYVVGKVPALEMIRKGRIGVRSLAELQVWNEKNLGRCRLNKCDVSILEGHSKWMGDRVAGVLMIRIVAVGALGERLDHVVVLDAMKGHVLDPVERFALANRPGVLGACLGQGSDSFEVAQVRELHLQPVGKGKKNRKKSGTQRSDSRKRKKIVLKPELVARSS